MALHPALTTTAEAALPVHLVPPAELAAWRDAQPAAVRTWLKATGVAPKAGTWTALPGADGALAGVLVQGTAAELYALAPLFYPAAIRATGVGTAVAVGRLGAMSGPLLAGKMLALGTGTVGVMAASAPGIVLAGVAVFWLMHRQQRAVIV